MVLMYILDWLGIELPEGSEALTKYAFGVFILSLVALLAFINILGYFLSLHLVQRYDLSNKYPRFKRLFSLYEKNTLFFILIETLFCLGCLSFLVITAFMYLKNIIF